MAEHAMILNTGEDIDEPYDELDLSSSPDRWAMYDADGTRVTVHLTISEMAKFHYLDGQFAMNKEGKIWRPGQQIPTSWHNMRNYSRKGKE